jgi:protein-S-isoprenylcysteine O-methyltransferase Ste14
MWMSKMPVSAKNGFSIDLVEKAILIVFFSFFAVRMMNSFLQTGAYISLLYLINEAALIAFVIFRRKAQTISQRPADWIIGFGGTCLPLFLIPSMGEPLIPVAFCAVLMLSGFFLHLAAKFTLRRSFGVVAANRGVKLSGPYRIVRHPMYAGYMITQLSLLLAGPNVTNLLVIGVAWCLQIARILAEEQVLRDDPLYRDLMSRTRYRLVPGVL